MNPVYRNILLSHMREPAKTGRPRLLSPECVLDYISYVLRTGCQWRYLKVKGASWQCIYSWFSELSKKNVFERAYRNLLNFYIRRSGLGVNIITDTTFVKNVFGRDCVGRSYYDRGRKATKVSALVDGSGIPLQLLFHPANKHDSKTLAHLLTKASAHIDLRGKRIHADRAYDSQRCRDEVTRHAATNRFAQRRRSIDKDDNRVRVVVEHTFGWFDKYRRIILRYDTLVRNFRSFHYLACFHLLEKRL